MSFLDLFRRKHEDEASRLARLAKTGRMADGTVLDVKLDGGGHVTHIFYRYNIAGVDYESSQELNAEQRAREGDYAAGSSIIIRYDSRQPGNSIVV